MSSKQFQASHLSTRRQGQKTLILPCATPHICTTFIRPCLIKDFLDLPYVIDEVSLWFLLFHGCYYMPTCLVTPHSMYSLRCI
ncbi:hypothetical protein K505DRAFT_31258 [Melanomma pulvis-pyrius CBS 109.77]|uniref:Uncharacterized protein n=1 Tax=Melanomma pulvis-pyrius CBS 109.77 TaxID=1314802 RepID=A0A6A6XCR2_9PLEO|nr:hypothetical protein K505DRAFT_31258 [Melanomma pulvis-pyrius CBS 109.77]